MHVIDINDIDTLEQHRQPWLDLLEQIPGSNTVFASPWWVIEWWKQFGNGAEMHVLLLMDQATLIGVAPLVIWPEPTTSGPLRVLRFIGHGTADHLDVCIRPEHRSSALRPLCDHIREQLRWHLIDLLDIPEDSPNLDLLRSILGQGAQTTLLLRGIVCPYLRIEQRPWETFYAAQRSKSSRKDLERRMRRLTELGAVDFHRYDDPDKVAAVFPRLFALYIKRWNQQYLSVSFAGPRDQRFYPAMAAAFAAQGRLDLITLELNQQVLAFSLGVIHGHCFTWLITAHDPDYAKYFPGELMIAHLLASVFARDDIEEFDFTRGEESYKYKWANDQRYNMRLLVARPSPFGLLPLLGTGAYATLRRHAKKSRFLRVIKLRWMGKLQSLLTARGQQGKPKS